MITSVYFKNSTYWDLLKQIQFTGMAKMLFNRTKMQKEPSELAELAENLVVVLSIWIPLVIVLSLVIVISYILRAETIRGAGENKMVLDRKQIKDTPRKYWNDSRIRMTNLILLIVSRTAVFTLCSVRCSDPRVVSILPWCVLDLLPV